MFFLNNYKHYKNIRFGSFEYALKEADKRSHKIIVETGVARGKTKFFFFTRHNWKDGMSTLIFSNYADYVGGHLYSCDIDQKNINNAKKFSQKFKKSITFVKDDSLNFLKKFKRKIDFLYLDALDGQFAEASRHQLKEIQCAEDKLHSKSLVLLDDKETKTNLSVEYMLKKNFKIINETDEQILLSYKQTVFQ